MHSVLDKDAAALRLVPELVIASQILVSGKVL